MTGSTIPHCPECKSPIEQLGAWRSHDVPLWIAFCEVCGCVMGIGEASHAPFGVKESFPAEYAYFEK